MIDAHTKALKIAQTLNERLLLSGRAYFEDDFSETVQQIEDIITECDLCGVPLRLPAKIAECAWTHRHDYKQKPGEAALLGDKGKAE